MLLVDAVYINYGGGLSLLHYLVDSLQVRGVCFHLLADARCASGFKNVALLSIVEAREKNRRVFYRTNKDSFTRVFCFGNVPPPIKMKMPVYTYFHNINMLTLADCQDAKQVMKYWLKRTYIKYHRNNTDEWFVQTKNTANVLINKLRIPSEMVHLFPFYRLTQTPEIKLKRTDYVFAGAYTGSKGHTELLEAWKILHKKGIDVTLHLTVSLGEEFLKHLQEAIEDGVMIVNHGFLPSEQLALLYMRCKATVYPSFNESFGLGLVEAMEAGCDVIASNRPFVFAVCQPSEVFEPSSPNSIVNAIVKYEKGECRKTRLLVSDMVGVLINRISDQTHFIRKTNQRV